MIQVPTVLIVAARRKAIMMINIKTLTERTKAIVDTLHIINRATIRMEAKSHNLIKRIANTVKNLAD